MRSRGFTLIEVMVAGAIGLVVVVLGCVALEAMQRVHVAQVRATELSSEGRLALEILSHDLRYAGDSSQVLARNCVSSAPADLLLRCPAILDPHPWRLTLARNSWPDVNGNGTRGDDNVMPAGATLEGDPENVVTYEFRTSDPSPVDLGPAHRGFRGSLVRIANPFGFAGAAASEVTILDHVVLDDRMRADPADETRADHRFDFAAFTYHVLSTAPGEFVGDPALVERLPSLAPLSTSFLLPPVRFFAIPDGTSLGPPAATDPWLQPGAAGYAPEIVGLYADPTPSATLLAASAGFEDDLRYVLDHNRIRAVRIALKIHDGRDDPTCTGGIDLDPRREGTARVYGLSATVELKVLSDLVRPGDA